MSKASAYFILDTIDGKQDMKTLKRELDTIHGVISVGVNAQKNSLAVDYDTSGVSHTMLADKLEHLGYCVKTVRYENHMM